MSQNSIIGKPIPRVDAKGKVTGKLQFIADIKVDRMLYGCVCTSELPHAIIKHIDTSIAKRLADVKAVMTASDIPGTNEIGLVVHDQPLLAIDRVRYVGDAIALVAAESAATAREACKLIKVEYEPLPGVYSVEESMRPEAPKIHTQGNIVTYQKIRKGDITLGFSKAYKIIERTYRISHQEHMYLEPQGALAIPNLDGTFTIYGAMQCPYYVQQAVARCLGLPLNKVKVIQTPTGGGFGGKEDVPSEVCAYAAVLAKCTAQPVQIIFTREEDVIITSKRHPMVMYYKMGVTQHGELTAAEIKIIADAGAYATLTPIVLYRSTVHAAGPYKIPHVKVDTYGVYTNHPPTGAFRGFGAPQVAFAHESMIEELAVIFNMDPIDFRLKNALDIGDETPTGQILQESVGLKQTLSKAKELAGEIIVNRNKSVPLHNYIHNPGDRKRRGKGVSAIHYGLSLGAKGWHLDASGALVQVFLDGSINLAIGGTDIGQGAFTVVAQIAAQELGVPVDWINVLPVSTDLVPDSGPTVASRTTVCSGNAVIDAIRKIKPKILAVAAEFLSIDQSLVDLQDGILFDKTDRTKNISFKLAVEECHRRNIDLSAKGWYISPYISFNSELGIGDAYYVYCYGTHVAEVEVDMCTYEVKVIKVVAAHDVGKTINLYGIEGQIEGGIVQGIGYALLERFIIDNGIPFTTNFSTYTIPTSMDIPDIEIAIIEVPSSHGPFGAKGIGEPAIIPTAGAIANAIYNATGHKFNELPITPERIFKHLSTSD